MDVFSFSDYKALLRQTISAHGEVRGYQSKLAAAAGCQKTYLSQVLHTEVHLTPDQAAKLTRFWHFSDDETIYFLDLVNLQRAGSPELKKILRQRLDHHRLQGQQLTRTLQKPRLADDEAQLRYYGVWYVAAIHVLTSIPAYSTPAAIATRLSLAPSLVEHTLRELGAMGLVKENAGTWRATGQDLHLPNDSMLTPIHHLNWRQRSLMRVQEGRGDDLHYTAIHALSKQDMRVLRGLIRDCVLQTRKVVEPSPEEELVCFTCDFFTV